MYDSSPTPDRAKVFWYAEPSMYPLSQVDFCFLLLSDAADSGRVSSNHASWKVLAATML